MQKPERWPNCEAFKSIDVRDWKRAGRLFSDSAFKCHWSRDGDLNWLARHAFWAALTLIATPRAREGRGGADRRACVGDFFFVVAGEVRDGARALAAAAAAGCCCVGSRATGFGFACTRLATGWHLTQASSLSPYPLTWWRGSGTRRRQPRCGAAADFGNCGAPAAMELADGPRAGGARGHAGVDVRVDS